jgi:hypothetical protein
MQHPDYPIEFKPCIAAYDWDQTYDILGFSYLPQGFESLMSLCNIPAYETLAVDRFTPYDYLWAINYSDYLYSFLGYFNYCPFNSIARRTAKDIDNIEIKVNNQPIWIDQFNNFNNLSSLTNPSYFITIPKGKVKITWLTNNGLQQSIISEIFTLNQCLVNFNFAQDTQIDLLSIKEDFKLNFCANSLVFSQLVNDQWVEFTPQGINNNFLLYSDIQIYFWEVQQALIAYFDYVHSNYGYIIVNESNPNLNEKKILVDAMPLKTYLKRISENISFSVFSPLHSQTYELINYSQEPLQIIYDYFPFYFYQLCFLQRANNNKWQLGNQLSDQGFFPKPNQFLKQPNNFLSFSCRNAHITLNQISFVLAAKPGFRGNDGSFFILPSLTTINDTEYIVTLEPPKYSHYLYDYPVFDLAMEWLINKVNSYLPSGVPPLSPLFISFYLSFFTLKGINHPPIFLGSLLEEDGLKTRFNKVFRQEVYSQNGIIYFSIATISKNPFLFRFDSIKKFNASLYELRTTTLYDEITNPDISLHILISNSFIYKIEGNPPFSIFDIANQETPDQYLSSQYLAGSGYIYSYETGQNTNEYGSDFNFTDNFDNSIDFELWTQEEYENLYNYGIISDSDYLIYLQNLKIQVQNNMVDSVRVKEIHSCLGASEFSYINNDPTTPIYMHIARKVDYIAKALGIAFNGDGSIMGIRQSKALDNGETIPAGWNFGQFGRNEGNNPSNNAQQGGNSSEERLGIVYDVRSNKFIKNPASGEEDINQGGYILCESIPQMLHIMLDDLDRALGLQTLGAIAITNQNYNDDYNGNDLSIKTPYYKYNGLGDAFVEVMHTLADTHKQAFQANIGSLKSQAITVEILGALGVGCIEKKIILEVDDQPVKIVYPGFNGITPSIADLQMWTLTNQSFLNEVMT